MSTENLQIFVSKTPLSIKDNNNFPNIGFASKEERNEFINRLKSSNENQPYFKINQTGLDPDVKAKLKPNEVFLISDNIDVLQSVRSKIDNNAVTETGFAEYLDRYSKNSTSDAVAPSTPAAPAVAPSTPTAPTGGKRKNRNRNNNSKKNKKKSKNGGKKRKTARK